MDRSRARAAAWILMAAAISVAAACGGAPAASTPPPAAAAPAPPLPSSAGSTAGATTRVDIDKIFPPGPGRELVLNNCQNCHTFVPIVVLQMEEAAWTRSSVDHRPRVTGLSDGEFKTLYDYLKANFNPTHSVPVLPPELLNTWTGN
jgi:hypothetical protein